jgi:hypothetical protein
MSRSASAFFSLFLSFFVYADNKIDKSNINNPVNQAGHDINIIYNKYVILPKTLPSKNKLKPKVKPIAKHLPKTASSTPENKFTIIGATNEEKYLIESELNRLKAISAIINITKYDSGDNDVNIKIKYKNNNFFCESFVTVRNDVYNQIITSIEDGENKKCIKF